MVGVVRSGEVSERGERKRMRGSAGGEVNDKKVLDRIEEERKEGRQKVVREEK